MYIESGPSLEHYMKDVKKTSLLSKSEEVIYATAVKSCKRLILDLCVSSKACLAELENLKNSSITDLRKFFLSQINEDTKREQIFNISRKLQLLIKKKIEGDTEDKLLNFLCKMTFNLKDLQTLSNPLKNDPSKKKTKALAKAFSELSTAKNKLIEGNVRLVFSRSKIFLNRGMSLEDLIQEGNLGLMNALEKYDVTKGYKFSTYATWWIDQAMSRSLANKARLIRIPVHMVENLNKITRVSENILKKTGKTADNAQIAKASGISEEKVAKAKLVIAFPHSLEEMSDKEGFSFAEILTDTSQSPEEAYERKELIDKMRALINRLSPLEQKVLKLRFGIGEKPVSI